MEPAKRPEHSKLTGEQLSQLDRLGRLVARMDIAQQLEELLERWVPFWLRFDYNVVDDTEGQL